MKTYLCSGLILLFSVSSLSCRMRLENSGSNPKHDLDRPTSENPTWLYLDLDREKIVDLFKKRYFYSDYLPGDNIFDVIVPFEDSIVKKVQSYHDRIDQKMRERYPTKMVGIPKPNALVINASQINASTLGVPECLENVSLKFNLSSDKSQNKSLSTVYFDVRQKMFVPSYFEPNDKICINKIVSKVELEERLKWIKNIIPECGFTTKEIGAQKYQVTLSETCIKHPQLTDISQAEQFNFGLRIPWFVYYTGIVSLMTEDELIFVIAHELSHYYRNHVIGTADSYDYLYRLADVNVPTRPPRNDDFKEFGERLKKALEERAVAASGRYYLNEKRRRMSGIYHEIPGQRFHSALFLFWRYSVNVLKYDNANNERKECIEAAKLCSESSNRLTDMELEKNVIERYRKCETAAISCFKIVNVSETINSTEKTPLWRECMKRISWQSFYVISLIENVPKEGELLNFWDQVSNQVKTKYPPFNEQNVILDKEINKQLSDIESQNSKISQDLSDLTKEGNEKGIGYYTYEQEADELALELMHHIGIDPRNGISAMIKMTPEFVSPPYTYVARKDCKALYENNWNTLDGKKAVMIVGRYEEPHHDTCFRAFNMDLEIKAHKYVE